MDYHLQDSKVDVITTLPKTKMDTQNDGLEKVTKNDNFWYQFVRFLGCD